MSSPTDARDGGEVWWDELQADQVAMQNAEEQNAGGQARPLRSPRRRRGKRDRDRSDDDSSGEVGSSSSDDDARSSDDDGNDDQANDDGAIDNNSYDSSSDESTHYSSSGDDEESDGVPDMLDLNLDDPPEDDVDEEDLEEPRELFHDDEPPVEVAAAPAVGQGGQEDAEQGAPPSAAAGQDVNAQQGATPTSNVDANGRPKPPKGRSIAHHDITNNDNTAIFLSFDIETAGEYVGIVQLSAELVRLKMTPGNTAAKDVAADVRRVDTFNEYVNPESDLEWDRHCCDVHGLHPGDQRILDADPMPSVWTRFLLWLGTHTKPEEKVILVAYNGERCDMKWLWKLTQAPASRYDLPDNIQYFLDPYRVISAYTSCRLNPKKSKLDSLELGVVWKFLNETNLEGAHDSLVDVKAQTDILSHEYFVPFINRSQSIKPVEEIFSKTQQNEWRKEMEPTRPVHDPWQEQTIDCSVEWSPDYADRYTGPEGGPPCGPSSAMKEAAKNAKSLACIFLFILPWKFFEYVSKQSAKYAYKDWVVEKSAKDRDGNTKKRT